MTIEIWLDTSMVDGPAAVAASDQHHQETVDRFRAARGRTFVVLCQPEPGGPVCGAAAVEERHRLALAAALIDLADHLAAGGAR